MVLKSKVVNIRGRDIKIKQLSFIGRITLMKDHSSENLIKVSISAEDYDYLDNLESSNLNEENVKLTVDEIGNLFKIINEVNGWEKQSDEVKVFPEQTQS